jgi:hypothetical protein
MTDKIDWTKTPDLVVLHTAPIDAADAKRDTLGPCVVVTGKHADGTIAGARYTLPRALKDLRATLDAAEESLRGLDAIHDMRVLFEPA